MTKDAIKKGYVRREMFEDLYDHEVPVEEWPPKDQSCAGKNHRRRIERNKRDENTR